MPLGLYPLPHLSVSLFLLPKPNQTIYLRPSLAIRKSIHPNHQTQPNPSLTITNCHLQLHSITNHQISYSNTKTKFLLLDFSSNGGLEFEFSFLVDSQKFNVPSIKLKFNLLNFHNLNRWPLLKKLYNIYKMGPTLYTVFNY